MTTAAIQIHPSDTVAVALADLQAGAEIRIGHDCIIVRDPVPAGHKIACIGHAAGSQLIKYGCPIGHATKPIAAGEWVHSHNLATDLAGVIDYEYAPQEPAITHQPGAATFSGYLRDDGTAGVRNELWVIPTVGCVNGVARALAQAGPRIDGIDGVHAFTHPHGCSQLGDDHRATQRILAGLVRHPNAAGVLVVGLGCENNNIAEFRSIMDAETRAEHVRTRRPPVRPYGRDDDRRVRFLACQDAADEYAAGAAMLRDLAEYARRFTRTQVPLSLLKVGVKCGGSDAFSGITANPVVGAVADRIVAGGGTVIMTEVPEMFGAEHLLLNRCATREVFSDAVAMINGFKRFFERCGQPIYENPSPGNRAGGITTLEEKSLGCTQKAGFGSVQAVLEYGGRAAVSGLNLLSGPGNDIISTTALAAAGAQVVLFTTGRGTPLGGPVPTIKIASTSALAARKPGWIDFDAGRLLDGAATDALADGLLAQLLSVASGDAITRNERNGCREIAIFKDGVTL